MTLLEERRKRGRERERDRQKGRRHGREIRKEKVRVESEIKKVRGRKDKERMSEIGENG